MIRRWTKLARARWRWSDAAGAALFLCLVAAVIAFGVLAYAPAREREAVSQWRLRLTAMAHDRQHALAAWLEEKQADTRRLTRFPTVHAWAEGARGASVQARLEQVFGAGADLDHEPAWLLDRAGEIVAGPAPAPVTQRQLRDFAAELIAGRGSPLLLHDDAGAPLALFGELVLHDSAPVGVVILGAPAERPVYEMLRSVPIGARTGELLLLEAGIDSLRLLSPVRHGADRLRPGLRVPYPQDVRWYPLESGGVAFARYRDLRGVPVVAAMGRVEGAPWLIVARVDQAEVYGPLRAELRNYALGSTVLLASLALLLLALRAFHRHSVSRAQRHSVERLRHIALNAADIMYRFRLLPTPSFEYINEAVSRVLGFTPEQCYQDVQLLYRSIHPDDLALVRQGMAETGRVPAEVRFLHANGSTRVLELINVPVHDEAGRVVALEGVARDITAAAAAERARRESEARHRALFETSPQGIIYWDIASGERTLNPAAREILNLTEQEATEALLSHLELYDEAGRRLGYEDLASRRAATAGEAIPPRMVRVVNRRDDRERWLLSGARPMYREGEAEPYQVYTIFTDVTPLRQAEAELRDTREMYRAVVENTTDVIARFDRDCRYLYINPSCQLYAPLSPGDLIGRTHLEAGHAPEISERWDRTIREVFADGRPREETYTLPGPHGPQHFVWRLFPEFDAEGRVQTVVTWSSDVTAQRLLEAQYQQAQKMEAVGRLAGGVAHDFNNLITAISGYGAMVMDQLPEESPVRADVAEIVRAGDRAAALTRQLLAFSRKQVLKVDVIDLGEVLRGMEKMLRRLIGEDVQLRLRVEDGLWRTLADAGQVEQVIMNLVVNARDAMPDGGTLSIGVRNLRLPTGSRRHDPPVPAGDYLALTVADTGAGMDAGTLQHLFEPFFTTKEKGKGTGLGLSTVYGIVRQSDGAIAVDSRPGAGTSFEILLPRAPGGQADAGDSTVRCVQAHSGERILVVEDEPSVRTLARRMLERAGYRVRLAGSGAEALAIEFPPGEAVDLLLTDVVMPGMSGRELARCFRERHPDVRVLYMSGYTDDVIASHGLLEPDVSLLQKPFTIEALQQAVRATLDQAPALW